MANEQVCIEHETVVGDQQQMRRALVAMGFKPTVKIVKTRRTARMDTQELGGALRSPCSNFVRASPTGF
ncbi:hypothetical protein ACFY4C_41595 [Actinomadura viridis]|uniref:hypothetical protein n=1 Tax=Actinomadura viridis TaxID=58110 RepID=UPI0036B4080D